MAITVAEFRARFPEFAAPKATDAQIQFAIDDATLELDEPLWSECGFYDLGLFYLAAHYLAESLMKGGATAGPITNKTVGQVSVGYGLIGGRDATLIEGNLASTKYGRRYMRYLQEVTMGAPVVIAC